MLRDPQDQERSLGSPHSNDQYSPERTGIASPPHLNSGRPPLYLSSQHPPLPGINVMNNYANANNNAPPLMNFMNYPQQAAPAVSQDSNTSTSSITLTPFKSPARSDDPVLKSHLMHSVHDARPNSCPIPQSHMLQIPHHNIPPAHSSLPSHSTPSSAVEIKVEVNNKNFDSDSENDTDPENMEDIESKDADAALLSFLINNENAKLRSHTTPEPTSNMDLLLQASIEAASMEAQKSEAFNEAAEIQVETYIRGAIRRVQKLPREYKNNELKPIDRQKLPQVRKNGWSRVKAINSNPEMRKECRKLIRGIQGCGRECDAKFQTLLMFASHVDKSHDLGFRPFLCPKEQCPWSVIGFHERSECTRHIRTKHYKAMYACDFAGCEKVYSRSDAFRRHVRQAHSVGGLKRESNSKESL